MRPGLITATFGAITIATALTVSAQTPQTQPQTERQKQGADARQSGNPAGQSVTVTGCLMAQADAPGRQAGTAGRSGDSDYVLTNVKMSQDSTASAIGLAATYQIKGVADAEMKKHDGHQVEVMGMVTPGATTGSGMGATGSGVSGRGATGTTGTTAATGTTAPTGAKSATGTTMSQSGKGGNLPELHATSIKMVSATCPAQ